MRILANTVIAGLAALYISTGVLEEYPLSALNEYQRLIGDV